mgnify:CR=1 FL=1
MQARDREISLIADGFHFLEGPRWHQGQLFFSDFYGGKVYSLDARNHVSTVCQWTKWVSGIGFAPNGDLLFVAVTEKKLMRYRDGQFSEVADLGRFTSHSCNDMLVDEAGRAYIGNFGFNIPAPDATGPLEAGEYVAATDILLVTPEGEVRIAGSDLVFPNGMTRSPDGRTLIVAETFRGRLSAFDIADDGTLSGHRTFADFAGRDFATVRDSLASGASLPDGICADSEGAVWIADINARGVSRVAPGGEILESISTGDLSVFAVALGGPDLKTLYMCAAPPFYSHDPSVDQKGVLLATQVDVPGIAEV